jgi:plasmid stabilization system protein ParE
VVTVWASQAIAELRKAFEYISRDSPQNARKFVDEIIALADRIPERPEIFPPDKYKMDNDGSWRAFEKFRYRISYRINQKEIRIIRMRHTSRSPVQY